MARRSRKERSAERGKRRGSSLPVVGADAAATSSATVGRTVGGTIARSRASRWRAVVLIAVHLLVAIHVAHWWSTGRTISPLEPSEAMEFAKHSIVNAGAIFFLLLILSTLLLGRFFCGWACHVVALQDLSRWLLIRVGIRPQPLRSRALAWVPFLAFAYMFLWPLAYRLWTGEPLLPFHSELTTSSFWATFPAWGVALMTFLVCGFLAVYFLGAKGFCTYGCPYGGIFAVADRLAPLRIRVTDACAGCGHCTATCTSNVRVHEEVARFGMVVDSGCMKCLDCVSVCPNDALYVGLGRPALFAKARDGSEKRRRRRPGLAEEAVLAIAFVLALATFRGLYGIFPFLASLGLSAVLAFMVLTTFRIATKPNLSFSRWVLKRRGGVERAGYVALALAAVVVGLWLHSAVVRSYVWRGGREYAATASLRSDLRSDPQRIHTAAERDASRLARRHLTVAERWGLLPDRGTELKLSWLAALAGDVPEFDRRRTELLAALPGNAQIRVELADWFRSRGRRADAAILYAEAVEIDPGQAGAALHLGVLELERGDAEAAQAYFEHAAKVQPDLPDAHYNLALLRLLRGDPEAAIAGFEHALVLEPEYLEARENLAGALCSLGRFEEGLAHYRAAIEQSPDDADTRVLAARAYLGLGEVEAARVALEAALEIDPAHRDALRLADSLSTEASGPS